MQEQQITGPELLQEGAWAKTKYLVAKLGRLEQGGKIIGRGKQAKAAADQIEALIKKYAGASITAVDNHIKQHYPEYPNMESKEDFLEVTEQFGVIYDSVVEGSELDQNDPNFLPTAIANEIIGDLRTLIKYYLDYKLSTVYQTMNEAQAAVNPISTARDDSTTMKTLKSNKLPLLLASIGASLGAFGWILKTPYIQELLNNLFDHADKAAEVVTNEKVLGMVGSGEGVTQTLGRLFPGVDLGPNAPVGNLQKVLAQIGGGNQDEGLKAISGMLKNPEKISELKQMLGSGKFHSMKELFNQQLGDPTSGKGGSWFETVRDGKISMGIKQAVIKGIATNVVKAGAVGAGLGSVLAPLGIALVAAGVTVKLLRMKGQKSSRAQHMNDLLLSLHDLEPTDAGSIALDNLSDDEGESNGAGTQTAQNQPQAGAAAQGAAAPTAPGQPAQGQPAQGAPAAEPAPGQPQAQAAAAQGQTAQGAAPAPKSGNPTDPGTPGPPATQGVPATQGQQVPATQTQGGQPQATGLPAHQKRFNSNADGIEDAQVVTDEPAGIGQGSQPGTPTGVDQGADGTATMAPKSGLLGRLDPASNKNAEANIKAFGETITSADKRNPEDIKDEIEYLTLAVKEIPVKNIMPKVKAIQDLLKSGDPGKQLKAVKGFRAMSAFIKNIYVLALKNYSEDSANTLERDMTYSGSEGLKKKAKPVADAQPVNEGVTTPGPGYQTPLFGAAEGQEDTLMGSLGQVCVKLIGKLTAGTALSKDEINYLTQKLSAGSYSARQAAGGVKNVEPGLVQKIIREVNKWLLLRINDYKAYLRYLVKQNGGQVKKGPPASAAPEEAGEPAPLNESDERELNPFFKGSGAVVDEGTDHPGLEDYQDKDGPKQDVWQQRLDKTVRDAELNANSWNGPQSAQDKEDLAADKAKPTVDWDIQNAYMKQGPGNIRSAANGGGQVDQIAELITRTVFNVMPFLKGTEVTVEKDRLSSWATGTYVRFIPRGIRYEGFDTLFVAANVNKNNPKEPVFSLSFSGFLGDDVAADKDLGTSNDNRIFFEKKEIPANRLIPELRAMATKILRYQSDCKNMTGYDPIGNGNVNLK